jgi:tRNA (guanine37-N1)-methyltransferase
MRFHIITLFPGLFDSYLADSMMKRAQDSETIEFFFYDPRSVTKNKHRKVDDIPYGGGPGMVMMAEPIIHLWEDIVKKSFLQKIGLQKKTSFKTIFLSPGGSLFSTNYAKSVSAKYTDIIFICGRYEGVDARVLEITQAEQVSIGDYVLTGGELAAMVMMDSIARQVPGVLGNPDSREEERISSHEVYTRPRTLIHKGREYAVPEVLVNGNHKEIDSWRSSR